MLYDDVASISDLLAAADQALFRRILTNKLHILQPSFIIYLFIYYLTKPTLVIIYVYGPITESNKENYTCCLLYTSDAADE